MKLELLVHPNLVIERGHHIDQVVLDMDDTKAKAAMGCRRNTWSKSSQDGYLMGFNGNFNGDSMGLDLMGYMMVYPLVNIQQTMERSTIFELGKSTISKWPWLQVRKL